MWTEGINRRIRLLCSALEVLGGRIFECVLEVVLANENTCVFSFARWSAINGKSNAIDELLRHGAAINQKDKFGSGGALSRLFATNFLCFVLDELSYVCAPQFRTDGITLRRIVRKRRHCSA